MLWVILSIIATLLWTVVAIVDKFIISHEVKDPILATVFSGIGLFLLFGIVSLLFGNILLPLTTILFAIIAGAMFNIAIWIYYRVMSKEEVSRFIPMLSTIPIFVLIFAFVFLEEVFSTLTYVGIILVVMGAFLISIRNITKKVKLSISFLIAIIAAIFFALRNIAIKFAIIEANIWSVFFWVGMGAFIVSGFLILFHHPHIRKRAKMGIKHLVLVGALAAIAFLILTMAVSVGPVSLVSTIIASEPLFVFLLATVLSLFHPKFLREKITKPIMIQKFIAIIMIITGVIMII